MNEKRNINEEMLRALISIRNILTIITVMSIGHYVLLVVIASKLSK